MRGFLHEFFHARVFFFETENEIVRAVFKKDDEAKGEEDKKDNPKKGADQTHKREGILLIPWGQRHAVCN